MPRPGGQRRHSAVRYVCLLDMAAGRLWQRTVRFINDLSISRKSWRRVAHLQLGLAAQQPAMRAQRGGQRLRPASL